MKRILFLVNGYGLGNSTRIHSIIQHIGPGCEFDIFGYGNSVKYFEQVPQVQNIFQGFPMEYGLKDGQIDFFSTVGKLFRNFKAIYKSRQYIKKLLKSKHYSLIVADSNFSTIFLSHRPKLMSVNSSDVIIKLAKKIKKRYCWTSFFTEWADYIYNLFVPDMVLSPFFESCRDTKQFRHIGLMARKEFHFRHQGSVKGHHVLIITGGAQSLNDGIVINHTRDDYELSVIGDKIQISGRTKKQSPTFNTSTLMNQSTIVLINGGFSSISEALAMAKPMIVIPVKGHIEQKINASWVQNNNLGLISSWENLEDSIIQIKDNYSFFKAHLLSYNYLNGSEQAASLILKEIENETLH